MDICDVPELVEVEVGADEELDDTLPYGDTDEEPTIDDNQGHDNSSDNSQAQRRSARESRKPKIFSYDKVGGPPVLVDVRCQLFSSLTPQNPVIIPSQ